jgi:PKD repeat protein
MNKLLISILLLALSTVFAKAQQPVITISGHIYNKETGHPIANQTVILTYDSTANYEYINHVVTDEGGKYYDKIVPLPGMVQGKILVFTYDCNGARISGLAEFQPGTTEITLDLSICGNQTSKCEAFFQFMSGPDNTLSVAFYDGSRSLPTSGKINYNWNFGDSTASTEQNPVHTYTQPGTYNVCLSINSDDGFCSSTVCLPVAAGTPIPGICGNSFIYYIDSISKEFVFEGLVKYGQADTWTWYFADGTTATGQRVSHAFNIPNSFVKVCLTTTGINTDGTVCTSNSCQDVYTYDQKPCWNAFTFQPDSSGIVYVFEGFASNTKVTSWTWDFNDGTSAKGQKVTHAFSFTNPGSLTMVGLTTTSANADGSVCTAVSCQQIRIQVPAPCLNSFWYQRDTSGKAYTFNGFAKNNQIISWAWDFGDGTTATGQTVTHIFANPYLAYKVCLTTKGIGPDGNTCTYSSCQTILIDFKSECDNYFKTNTSDGSTYTFASTIITGAAANYYWDFGDGTSATSPQITHTFKIENEYDFFDVCLTTTVSMPGETGFNECKSIICQRIIPGNFNQPCEARLGFYSDQSGYLFTFINNSFGKDNVLMKLDFGDGATANNFGSFQHRYTTRGIYTVCLTIGDSLSECYDTFCQEIGVDTIQPGCKASFALLPAGSPPNTQTECTFLNTSAPGYTSQYWKFGDGSESTDFSPVHTYSYTGDFTACLYIWDSLGKCQSDYCKSIIVGKVNNDNTISGIVFAGNTVANQGKVWLISANNYYNAETKTDSTGIYHFTGVPYGKYYIYAMLNPNSADSFAYMPTYYDGSISWQEATLITTTETNAWYPVNLVLSRDLIQGDGVITGTINWDWILVEGIGNPAANVEVILYNSADEPIAYTYTDSDGTYIFENLPYGNYTLQADMTGRVPETVRVNLSENTGIVNISFIINEAAITFLGINDKVKSKFDAGNPYPNPVGETLYLEMNAVFPGSTTVEVIDMQGRIVHRELIELANGNNRIRIKTGNFVKGVYQLRIETDGQKPVQRRFVR